MNSTNNVEDVQRDILEYGSVRVSMIIIYIITIIIGILGNIFALKNVRRIAPSQGVVTSTNTLLCALFIVNLVVLTVVVPVKMVTGLSLASVSHKIVTSGVCGFFGYVSSGSGVVLVWIHCLLGAERCIAVLKPIVYSRVCTASAAFRFIAGGAFCVAITSLFIPFRVRSILVLNITSVLVPNKTYTRTICDYNRDEPSDGYGTNVVIYSICLLIFLIIPMIATVVSYVIAVTHLKVLMSQQEAANSRIYGNDDVAIRRKFIITMLVVLATYVFCWTPLIAFEVYRINGGDAFFPSCVFVNACIWWHVYFICATAPYIFCGSSPDFRRNVRKLLCKRSTGTYSKTPQSADVINREASAGV